MVDHGPWLKGSNVSFPKLTSNILKWVQNLNFNNWLLGVTAQIRIADFGLIKFNWLFDIVHILWTYSIVWGSQALTQGCPISTVSGPSRSTGPMSTRSYSSQCSTILKMTRNKGRSRTTVSSQAAWARQGWKITDHFIVYIRAHNITLEKIFDITYNKT